MLFALPTWALHLPPIIFSLSAYSVKPEIIEPLDEFGISPFVLFCMSSSIMQWKKLSDVEEEKLY